jgi:hypothetical protein
MDTTLARTLQETIAREGGEVAAFQDRHFFLVKHDVGAFGEPGFEADGSVIAVTGEPILDWDGHAIPSRMTDSARLRRMLDGGDIGALARCRGNFALCHYDPASSRLILGLDHVGTRPVYVHEADDKIVFATCLRVLEALDSVPRRPDVCGIAESTLFGYPLGERTAYESIRSLRGGTVMQVRGAAASRIPYFLWRDVRPAEVSRAEALADLHRRFLEATACRGARSSQASSFLTGGLDSRCVVAALVELGKSVDTLTFEIPGSKDALFAERLAKHLGTRHHGVPFDLRKGTRGQQMMAAGTIQSTADTGSEFPRLIFSGDGGSVGLGFIYSYEPNIARMRAGQRSGIWQKRIDRYASRALVPSLLEKVKLSMRADIDAELARPGMDDPAWDYHAFLMDNDQRRHFHEHFETIDLTGTEVLTPFFDVRVMEAVVAHPFDWFLRHEFYNDWLNEFAGGIASVPWQAYPGHAPCPLPEAAEGRRATGLSRAERYEQARLDATEAWQHLLSRTFPGEILRRPVLLGALAAHGLRLGNYGYMFRVANEFARAAARSNVP